MNVPKHHCWRSFLVTNSDKMTTQHDMTWRDVKCETKVNQWLLAETGTSDLFAQKLSSIQVRLDQHLQKLIIDVCAACHFCQQVGQLELHEGKILEVKCRMISGSHVVQVPRCNEIFHKIWGYRFSKPRNPCSLDTLASTSVKEKFSDIDCSSDSASSA